MYVELPRALRLMTKVTRTLGLGDIESFNKHTTRANPEELDLSQIG